MTETAPIVVVVEGATEPVEPPTTQEIVEAAVTTAVEQAAEIDAAEESEDFREWLSENIGALSASLDSLQTRLEILPSIMEATSSLASQMTAQHQAMLDALAALALIQTAPQEPAPLVEVTTETPDDAGVPPAPETEAVKKRRRFLG